MKAPRFFAAATVLLVSFLPLSELYAACSYQKVMGGEWMYCDNGTCWSRSLWTNDGQLVEGSTSSGCYAS
jgi:hypothetical protein